MSYFLTDVIIEEVSHKVSFGGKNYEYFNNLVTCIIIIKLSHYVCFLEQAHM